MRKKRDLKDPTGKRRSPKLRPLQGPELPLVKGGVTTQNEVPPPPSGFLAIRWDMLAAAIVFGYFGSFQWFDHHPHWWKGAPLQLLSILFLWWAFPFQKPGVTPSQGTGLPARPIPPSSNEVMGSGLRPLPVLLTLLLAGIGQWFFLQRNVPTALAFWAAALAAFLWAKPSPWEPPQGAWGKREGILLLALLSIACGMRFPFLWEHFTGLQVDEGHCVIDGFEFADGVLESPFVTTGWGANASFHFWWLGRFMEVFGQSLPAARGFSAAVSIGVLIVFYHLSRCFFGVWSSWVATALMSVGWWFLFYSLSPFQNILVVLWELLTFLFLFKALRDGKKLDYALGGLFLSMMMMEYLPGRLGVLMVGAVLAGLLLTEGMGFLKKQWKGLAFGSLVMLWWMGPFIRYFIENFEYCMGRSKGLSLIGEIQRTGNFHLFWEKWYWTFLSVLHFNSGTDLRFSAKAPMIDPVSGALFLLGLVLLLMNLKKRLSWFILSGLFFGFFANAMAIQGQDPDPTYINGQRYFIVVPFLFLLAAWGLEFLRSRWNLVRPPGRLVLLALFLAPLAFAVTWNSRVYYQGFRDFKACTSYWGDLGFNHIQVGEFINENFRRCHMVVDWEYDSSTVQVLIKGRSKIQPLHPSFVVPIRQKVDRNVMLMTLAWNFKPIQEAIRKTYPKAKWGELLDVVGFPALLTVEIAREDIEAFQKGGTVGTLP